MYVMYKKRFSASINTHRIGEEEARYQALFVFVYQLFYIMSIVSFEFLPGDPLQLVQIKWFIFILFTQVLCFALTFLTTKYPIYLFRKYNYAQTSGIHHVDKIKTKRKTSLSDANINDSDHTKMSGNEMTLQRFIRTQQGFNY